MPKVVDIRPKIEAKKPHLQGRAVCLACKHEWEAVTPVGCPDGLECPSCGTSRGIMAAPTAAFEDINGDPVSYLTCATCESSVFMLIYQEKSLVKPMCRGCGQVMAGVMVDLDGEDVSGERAQGIAESYKRD